MAFTKLKTACDAPLFVQYDSHDENIIIAIIVMCGTYNELWPKEAGLAHLYEHLLLEETKLYASVSKLTGPIEKRGGGFSLGTTTTWTSYLIEIPKRNFPLAVQVLHQMMTQPIFTETHIKIQIQEIFQEINRIHDQPDQFVEDLFTLTLFAGHPFSRPIGGAVESLNSFKPQDLYSFKERFYHPKNFAFIISGDITPLKARRVLDQYFKNEINPKAVFKRPSFRPFSRPKGEFKVFERPGIVNAYVAIGSYFPATTKNKILAELFAKMLIGFPRLNSDAELSSPATEELKTKTGLAYNVEVKWDTFQKTGKFLMSYDVSPKRLTESRQIVESLIEKTKSDVSRLERIKKRSMACNRGRVDLTDDDTFSYLADEIYSLGYIVSSREKNKMIRSVRIKDIENFVNQFLSPHKLVTVVLKPA